MNIYEKLSHIQGEIRVNKSNYNSFGKYSYRSAEDILEAAKPICRGYGCVLVLDDEIVYFDGRFYVKATATLTDVETLEKITATAYAREEETKKGMDASQVTGACSSYARKYAMNGLFNLDDAKDADTDAFHEQTTGKTKKVETAVKTPKPTARIITPAEVILLERAIEGYPASDPVEERITKICHANAVSSLEELTVEKYTKIMSQLGGTK